MNSRLELNREKLEKIEKEEKNAAVKRIVKKIVLAIILIFLIAFLTCLYIIKIATTSITVNEEAIIDSKISESISSLKVIQFSDLHYDNHSVLIDAVKTINKRNPDLVLFTGDLLKDNIKLTPKRRARLVSELKKVEASLGKYAVLGESDNEEAVSILIDCGFTILDDSNEFIYRDSNNPLMLVGLNTNNKSLNLVKAFTNYNENIFTILMFHKPDYLDEVIKTYKVDLALAGHSHLGEIRIPYVKNMANKDYASKYTDSYYDLGNTKFYISSGLGMSDYDVRINSRCSINFLRLRKTD